MLAWRLYMKILAIETSCDETAISLLETSDGASFTMLAKREHLINLPILLKKINPQNVDLIAVTYGPGLEPAPWTGINFAQDLAKKWDVPIVATDHMHGHIVSAQMKLSPPNT